MALIETNYIRPQEVYDRNTGESKVRYRSYDGNDRFIPVVEGENGVPKTLVEVTHAELKAMRDAGKLTPGALYRITDYNCTTTQENTRSAGHQFDIVLLALSEDKLAEEGWAMEHPTDVYDVTFEKGEGETKKCYLYKNADSFGNFNLIDVETLLGTTLYDGDLISINEENKTAIVNIPYILLSQEIPYNYFQNSNLSAWKVWYCLDNDKSRFAWADDSMDEGSPASIVCTTNHVTIKYYRNPLIDGQNPKGHPVYGWSSEGLDDGTIDSVYTLTLEIVPSVTMASSSLSGRPNISINEYTPAHEGTGLPNGRGVIYRLIDEFNNDIKYDFKNIQFKRTITNGQYNAKGTETWCYTLNVWYNDMCQDASIVGNIIPDDTGHVVGVYNNKFGYVTAYTLSIEGVTTFAFALGDNVILSFDYGGYFGIFSNTIGNLSYRNTIGSSFYSNTIGDSFYSNIIKNECNSNIIGNYFSGNTIGDNFNSNIVGNYFSGKTIGDNTSIKNYGNNGVELATKE